MRSPEVWAGLFFGIAAAVPGVSAVAFGVRPSHLFVLAAIAIVLIALVRSSSLATWRPGPVEVAGLVFVLGCVAAEMINSAQLGFRPDLVSAAIPLLWILSYTAARHLVILNRSLGRFLAAFAAPAVPAAIVAVIQGLWPAQSTWIFAIAPSETAAARVAEGLFARSTGLVGHWTGLGYYLCTALVALCILLVLDRSRRTRYPVVVISITVVFGGIVATLTFAPILTAGAILATTWFMIGVRRSVASVMAVLTTALVVALVLTVPGIQDRLEQQSTPSSVVEAPPVTPQPAEPSDPQGAQPVSIPRWLPSTVQWRLHVWTEETIPAIGERPFTGWGSELYSQLREPSAGRDLPDGMRWLSSESQPLWLSIAYGIPVAILFGVLIGSAAWVLVSSARRAGAGDRAPAVLVLVYLALLIGGSLIVPLFTNRGIPFSLWVLIGAVSAIGGRAVTPVARVDQQAQSPAGSP